MEKHKNFFTIRLDILAIAFLLLVGCRPQPNEPEIPGSIRFEFNLQWSGEDCAVGAVQTDHMGHPVRIDNLQMYIAPFEIRNERGEWLEINDVALLDFGVHGQKITAAANVDTYNAIRFGMGLPAEINTDIDPASYANDHPLSVPGSAGMFWTWSSGYVFVKYEGKFATESGAQLIEPLSYHCGTDESYRTVVFELEDAFAIESQELTAFTIDFNAAAALIGEQDAIDIVEDPVTHNAQGTVLGERLMDLMDDAWNLTRQ